MSTPFRDEQCPERGPALSHMAEFPNYVCVECQLQCVIELVRIDGDVLVSIGERECVIDHNALIPNRNEFEDGSEAWSVCPNCEVILEPRYEQVGPQGASWKGKGRTGSPRQQAEWSGVLQYMQWFYGAERGQYIP